MLPVLKSIWGLHPISCIESNPNPAQRESNPAQFQLGIVPYLYPAGFEVLEGIEIQIKTFNRAKSTIVCNPVGAIQLDLKLWKVLESCTL